MATLSQDQIDDDALRIKAALPAGLITFVWIVLVFMHEASRLADVTLTPSGRGYSLWDASGILAFAHPEAWREWGCAIASSECQTARDTLVPFVALFAILHFLLVFAVVAVLMLYFRPAPHPRPAAGRGWALCRWRVIAVLGPRWLPVIALGTGLILLVTEGAFFGDPQFAASQAVQGIMPLLGTATWVAILWSVIATFADRSGPARVRFRALLKPVLSALRTQRLPIIALIVFAAMGTFAGHGVLEQVPDVARGWLLTDGATPQWRDLILAIVLVIVVSLAIWGVARQRATRIRLDVEGRLEPRGEARYLAWVLAALTTLLIAISVAIVAAIASDVRGEDRADQSPWEFIDRTSLTWFVVIILAIVGISRLLGNRKGKEDVRYKDADAVAALVLGDVVAAMFFATLFVSVAKAYIGPWLLGDDLGQNAMIGAVAFGAAVVALVSVPLFQFLAPRVARALPPPVRLVMDPRVDTTLSPDAPPELVDQNVEAAQAPAAALTEDPSAAGEVEKERLERSIAWLHALQIANRVAAVAVLLIALLTPRWLMVLGPVAVLVTLVGAWVVVIATVSAFLGKERPLPFFERLGLRTDPILTFALLLPLILSQTGGVPAVHAIRDAQSTPLPTERPTIADVVTEWERAPASDVLKLQCAAAADPMGTDSAAFVRPLLLVAAEGGGIRAAEWTADVLQEFADTDCGRHAVAISSGVSGGAVGLALVHQGSGERISDFVVGQREVVSLAITGLLVRDAFAALTGIRMPTFTSDGDPVWEDRAGLIESRWRGENSRLDDPFDAESKPSSATGYTVFNSLAANLGCKVVVSQVDLNPSAAGRDKDEDQTDADFLHEPINCNEHDSELSTTIDLVDFLDGCPLSLDWATAAMTAARFPYVTPAGRLSNETITNDDEACGHLRDLQLIDGGYFENSGLATLSDSAPQFVGEITAHNAGAEGTFTDPYIVPVVVFLHNEPGGDVVSARDQLAPELVVPLLNSDAIKAQAQPEAWLARLSAELSDVCEPDEDAVALMGCEDAVAAFRSYRVPHGVAVVAPATAASLSVPLGWTLSGASEAQLNKAVVDEKKSWQLGDECGRLGGDVRSRYYATLREVLCVVNDPPPATESPLP